MGENMMMTYGTTQHEVATNEDYEKGRARTRRREHVQGQIFGRGRRLYEYEMRHEREAKKQDKDDNILVWNGRRRDTKQRRWEWGKRRERSM